MQLKPIYPTVQISSISNNRSWIIEVLRSCQSQRLNENVSDWGNFFFDALKNVQEQLMQKLKTSGIEMQLSPRNKAIITFIGNRPGCKSGDIASKLGIPNPMAKRILTELVKKNLIEKYGIGPGTNYSMK